MPDLIPYWDYLREYALEEPIVLGAIQRVLRSGRLILGPEVEGFERELAGYAGVRHAVGVNSGTDAIFLALKALDIGPGDEVITVSNTAVPTVSAIRAAGATPVFVDVEDGHLLMDASLLDDAVTGATRAILPVHLYGLPADMDAVMEAAHRHGLRVIEDCAQAAGARFGILRVGGIGDIGAFSFYPTKVLGALGDAGAVLTSDDGIAKRLGRLRFYGMEGGGYYSVEEGYNSRLDELQAAVLRVRLARLDEAVSRRRACAAIYSDMLEGAGDLRLPVEPPGRSHQYYAYTIRTSRRDSLATYLARNGIGTKVNYPTPVHMMSGYGFLGLGAGSLPVTERAASEILSLPMWPGLRPDEAAQVAETVRGFFG